MFSFQYFLCVSFCSLPLSFILLSSFFTLLFFPFLFLLFGFLRTSPAFVSFFHFTFTEPLVTGGSFFHSLHHCSYLCLSDKWLLVSGFLSVNGSQIILYSFHYFSSTLHRPADAALNALSYFSANDRLFQFTMSRAYVAFTSPNNYFYLHLFFFGFKLRASCLQAAPC